jgi:lipoyl(octanoyl) transferase
MSTRILDVARPGRVPYDRATAWQESLVERRLAPDGTDVLLLLEHPPVYTLGRGADPRFLGKRDGAVPVFRTSRGGQVTYHGPGQLVGYPVLDLRAHRQDVHWYVRQLEQVLIDALAAIGIPADRVAGLPGVWVEGRRKIASIGVGIRRWVTWHGFALNVSVDLTAFDSITPCGIVGVEMTSIAREGGTDDFGRVSDVVLAAFVARFGYDAVVSLDDTARSTVTE